MFTPFSGMARAKPEEPAEPPAGSEVENLKQEMEAMRRQLSELALKK